MKLFLYSITLFIVLNVVPALSWDGTDLNTGDSIEIEPGNLVRAGREIEYFNYNDGEYHLGEVESIMRFGPIVELEITDSATGENKTLEMEDAF